MKCNIFTILLCTLGCSSPTLQYSEPDYKVHHKDRWGGLIVCPYSEVKRETEIALARWYQSEGVESAIRCGQAKIDVIARIHDPKISPSIGDRKGQHFISKETGRDIIEIHKDVLGTPWAIHVISHEIGHALALPRLGHHEGEGVMVPNRAPYLDPITEADLAETCAEGRWPCKWVEPEVRTWPEW